MRTIKNISAVILLFWGLNAFAQDCKNLRINKKDEFTGEQIKQSKTHIFKKNTYEEAYFQIDKTSDSLKLTFLYNNSDRRFANAGVFSCQQGNRMFVMLEDSSVLKLNLKGQFYYSRTETAGVGTEILLGSYAGLAKSNKVIFEPEYTLTSADMDNLKDKKILKIRVEASGVKGDTGQKLENIELVISGKDAIQFQKDVICILN